jgi:hypothetical protein
VPGSRLARAVMIILILIIVVGLIASTLAYPAAV